MFQDVSVNRINSWLADIELMIARTLKAPSCPLCNGEHVQMQAGSAWDIRYCCGQMSVQHYCLDCKDIFYWPGCCQRWTGNGKWQERVK